MSDLESLRRNLGSLPTGGGGGGEILDKHNSYFVDYHCYLHTDHYRIRGNVHSHLCHTKRPMAVFHERSGIFVLKIKNCIKL